MKLTATCFTEKYGIHKVQINAGDDGNLPDFVAVKIENKNDDLKLDPRNLDWDIWVKSGTGRIPGTEVVTKRFIGTIYMENPPSKNPEHGTGGNGGKGGSGIIYYNVRNYTNPYDFVMETNP